VGPGPTLVELDPSTAKVLSSTPVPGGAPKGYAVAPSGGALWVFTYPTPSGSSIFRYDLSTQVISPVNVPGTPPLVMSAAAPVRCSQ
jgi:DNA-binding beta-propeller fold protein YncE